MGQESAQSLAAANKRISIPESFLAVDAILILMQNIVAGLVVYPEMIARHIRAELPFMMTENIIMEGVKRGGDRQELHERIRVHSLEAGRDVKVEGGENDLLARIAGDPAFGLDRAALEALAEPAHYTGRAAQQVAAYIAAEVDPILGEYGEEDDLDVDIQV